MLIKELQEVTVELKVENLKLIENISKLEHKLTMSDTNATELQTELDKFKSLANIGSTNSYIIRQVQKDPKSLDVTL